MLCSQALQSVVIIFLIMLLEVCVDSIESALAAAEGGASRIELCSALSEGGLTPTSGMLTIVKMRTQSTYPELKIFPMIRPRRGDFLYTEAELDSMVVDINTLKFAADGFVFGCLQCDGSLDVEANRRLLTAAAPLPCTLHRAFDVCNDPIATAELAETLGFKRILTSGQRQTAIEGVETIKKLQSKFEGRIVVMAGVGINERNAVEIIKKTGVKEIHSSASIPKTSKMEYRNSICSMSASSTDEFQTLVVDVAKVCKIVDAANSAISK